MFDGGLQTPVPGSVLSLTGQELVSVAVEPQEFYVLVILNPPNGDAATVSYGLTASTGPEGELFIIAAASCGFCMCAIYVPVSGAHPR